MIDPPFCCGSHRRLGPEGEPDAGGGEHRQIVRAVADGHCLLERDPTLGGQGEQRFQFGLAGHERPLHSTGDTARRQLQPVRHAMIKTEPRRNPLGKNREPARNERGRGSSSAHRRYQRSCSGGEPNAGSRFFEHPVLHPCEQAHPRLKRGGKIDLAIHRATRDVGDLRPKAEKIGKLVEHFIRDDRRLHIGDEKALAPASQRLDHNIDRRAADHGTRGFLDRGRADRVADEIAGFVWREPDRPSGNSEIAGYPGGQARKARPVAGTGNQGDDEVHRRLSYSDARRRFKPAGAAPDRAPPVIVIAGPTASGKSALALDLADELGGIIINADSLQSYRDLRILTARPDEAAERRVPHRLYGFLDAAERGSAALWLSRAVSEIAAATAAGRLPILVGGTGLYLRAVQEGLAPVPEIPAPTRQQAVALYRTLGGCAFRKRLMQFDPVAARRLSPADKQRLIRAYEVVQATGVPIETWQRRAHRRPTYRFGTILLMPPRDRLYDACNARFAGMIERDGLAEAAALAARGLDPELPAMKAVGLRELWSHLKGEMPLGTAVAMAQRATRRYAKRQMTWFRHQMRADLVLDAQFSESLLRCSRHFIDRWLLTEPP